MNEQVAVIWQVIVSSVVTLLVAIVGIVSTCIAANASANAEMKKAVALRFVDMFETVALGLSTISDVYTNIQILFSMPLSKEALTFKVQTIIQLGEAYREAAKTTDCAMLRLNVYFPDPQKESVDISPSTSSIFNLCSWLIALDAHMKKDGRMEISDEEFAQYQIKERLVLENIPPLRDYYNQRRSYFNMCYAAWRKKNFSFLKWK